MPLVRGVVRGVPIVGPMLDKAVDAGVAAPSAVIPGQSVEGSYDALQAGGQRIAAEHPVADTIGNVAGGVMSTGLPARRDWLSEGIWRQHVSRPDGGGRRHRWR